MMRLPRTLILAGAAVMTFCAGASAQTASVADPHGPAPNPAHIPFVLPNDIKWETGSLGEKEAKLFGDPEKPGLYGLLVRWDPGTFSQPHFHNTDRFVYVVSGTWWVSSSTHYDPSQTYPVPAGSTATDVANTVHWDGARTGGPPVLLELVGIGPVTTFRVDETGAPKSERPGG